MEISKAQDIEAGDGTTSVVVLAGALLNAASLLMEKGIHPTSISDGFQIALHKVFPHQSIIIIGIRHNRRMFNSNRPK